MEGNLTGFDEFMNIIMENTVEINTKSEKSASLGTLMLKSDCIAMLLVKPATIQSQTQMDGN
jgi:small nuclear ribonucleoprotein E